MSEPWASGGAYEPYVGRWSRLVAIEFVDWLAVQPGGRWVDVGCGTGALTTAILESAEPDEVLGVDPSQAYVDWASARVDDPRIRFVVADASHLPTVVADAVVSGLVLNFVPDPAVALAAMVARAAPGRSVAAYVWDYAGKMELMRYFWDAAAALDPLARELDEGMRFAICQPDRLRELWEDADLVDVTVRGIEVATPFRDFDDYWMPFLGGQGPAPGYAVSLEEEQRRSLRDEIRARLPVRPDGSIQLVARAWAVRGRRPR